MKVDLGEPLHTGTGRRECIDCGILFTPKGPSHTRCSDCIRLLYRDEDEDNEETGEST